MSIRPIKQISSATPTLEGAGVKLHRAFGFGDTEKTDPFLLFDDFRNNNIKDYIKGFPWHPHRGIETITYVLEGEVTHEDSLGNKGDLRAGDVQWMTAGSGIIHQEMPKGTADGKMHGFQLWANLPASRKMIDPRYQDIPAKVIPEEGEEDGTKARIITGNFMGKTGPVEGIAANPVYVDIYIPPHKTKNFKVDIKHQAFAYVFQGYGDFKGASAHRPVPTEYVTPKGASDPLLSHPVENRNLILFDTGDTIQVSAGAEGIRFLLVSGEPLKEPVAWHGPIVMNTREELYRAFEEYQEGTFLKHKF